MGGARFTTSTSDLTSTTFSRRCVCWSSAEDPAGERKDWTDGCSLLARTPTQVSSWYTLVIFTASMQEYADPVIDWLDGGRGIFAKRFFRDVRFLPRPLSPPLFDPHEFARLNTTGMFGWGLSRVVCSIRTGRTLRT